MAYERSGSIRAGDRFGLWTAVSRAPNRGPSVYWVCRCQCGNEREVRADGLKNGRSTSCGCRPYELQTHGRATTPEYKAWTAMHQRCENPNSQRWPQYGARGIRVDERWSTFEAFLSDMGERPSGHSLERIDNDGPYSPENCRWATSLDQGRNTRRNRVLTFDGRSMTVSAWASELKIDKRTLLARLRLGWSVERALSTPVRAHVRH